MSLVINEGEPNNTLPARKSSNMSDEIDRRDLDDLLRSASEVMKTRAKSGPESTLYGSPSPGGAENKVARENPAEQPESNSTESRKPQA
jgi:hypothetical protein